MNVLKIFWRSIKINLFFGLCKRGPLSPLSHIWRIYYGDEWRPPNECSTQVTHLVVALKRQIYWKIKKKRKRIYQFLLFFNIWLRELRAFLASSIIWKRSAVVLICALLSCDCFNIIFVSIEDSKRNSKTHFKVLRVRRTSIFHCGNSSSSSVVDSFICRTGNVLRMRMRMQYEVWQRAPESIVKMSYGCRPFRI